MTVEQSWVGRQPFWRLGATAQVQFNGIYSISLRGGQCAAAAAAAAVVPAVVAARACLAASGPLPACCDGGERHARRDGGRVRQWARHALGRV